MLLLLAACGQQATTTVLAASSLAAPFTVLEGRFEAEHPDVDVVLSFAGSHTLARQIETGLRADAFASADAATMMRVSAASEPLASNELVFAFGPTFVGPPTRDGLLHAERLVLADEAVPLGTATQRVLHGADPAWAKQVEGRIVSREPSAASVFTKVRLGEADSAVLFATDARRIPGVRTVPADLSTTYRITSFTDAGAEWVAFVRGPIGRDVFDAHGFGP